MKAALALPNFRRLVLAYALNEIAWSVGNFSLSLMVYRRTGSALASTAFFLASQLLPAFITPSLVARLDRFDPRRVLAILYGLQSVVFLVLAMTPAHFVLAPVLAVVLVAGSLGLAARPILRATSGRLLTPAGLLRDGNAVINAAFALSILLGPIIGSALVLTSGITLAVLVDAAVFATIAFALWRVRGTSATRPESIGAPRPQVRAAIARVNKDPAVRRILLFQAVAFVIFSMTVPVEVVLAQHVLHAGAAGYAALLSAWGSGAIVGSVIYARGRTLPAWVLIALGTVSVGVGFLLMGAAPTIVLAVVGAVIGGVGNGIEPVAQRTVLQEQTEGRFLTLTLSLNESIYQAAPGPGFLLGGLLAELVGARLAFLVAGVGAVTVALLAPLMLRDLHHIPASVVAAEPVSDG